MRKTQWIFKSTLGPLYLVASDQGLEGVYFDKQAAPIVEDLKGPARQYLAQTVQELTEYFAGTRQTFEVPLVVRGTAFQQQVWQQLCRIPFGKTCSYRDIAANLQNANAFRAVGNANGKNPYAIIVPCHRVIAADGTLGGYAGGVEIKRKLLALERM
jgi:methylated-DNA-[protein]-cysteine S-methyltransferase